MKNDEGAASTFVSAIIGILNGIGKRKGQVVQIEPDTPLFESRILDSMTFVEFITALEVDLNVSVPDQMMSTQYFLTPAHIAANFSR
jgi:acyl carrier protein